MRQFLAASLAVLALGSVGPAAFAADNNAMYLSPAPGPSQASNPNSGVNLYTNPNDEVGLRGRLSTIPQGTIMMVKFDHPITSYSSKVGDPVSAVVEADVYQDGQVAIPAGSAVEGSVTGASPAAHLGKGGALEIRFSSLKTPTGMTLPVRAHIVTADNTGVIKGDTEQAQVLKSLGAAAGITGAGTLVGTAAGGLLGAAGSGALFGLAAGAIGGIGYAVVRQGKQVEIPAGGRISIVLDQPVGIN